MTHSLWPHGLYPDRLLCPRDFPSKNTGVGCHFLLQEDLPNPRIEPVPPALVGGLFTTEPPAKPPWFQVKSESEIRSVVSYSLQPHGLYSPWNPPGQNTGVGSLSFLQGIFLVDIQIRDMKQHGILEETWVDSMNIQKRIHKDEGQDTWRSKVGRGKTSKRPTTTPKHLHHHLNMTPLRGFKQKELI